jgi:hypothetical protein
MNGGSGPGLKSKASIGFIERTAKLLHGRGLGKAMP